MHIINKMLIECDNSRQLNTYISGGRMVVVYYHAPWCQPCKISTPRISDLSGKFPEVDFLKINVDTLPSDVSVVPTVELYKDAKCTTRTHGADISEIIQVLEKSFENTVKSHNVRGGTEFPYLLEERSSFFDQVDSQFEDTMDTFTDFVRPHFKGVRHSSKNQY